jgi:hypothetical protein
MNHHTNRDHRDSYGIKALRASCKDQIAGLFVAVAVDVVTGRDVVDSVGLKARRGGKDESTEGAKDQESRAKCDIDHGFRNSGVGMREAVNA